MSATPSPLPSGPDLAAYLAALVDEIRGLRADVRAALERNPRAAAPADPAELLDVRQAADEVGVDVKSIRCAITLGKLPASNPGKRQTRIRRGDLVEWLRGRGRPARGRSTGAPEREGRR